MEKLEGQEIEEMGKMEEWLNERERKNEESTKQYREWKLMEYLERKKVKEYEGMVIRESEKGIKFYIKEIGYDGFIKNEKYKVNEKIRLRVKSVDYHSYERIIWEIIK